MERFKILFISGSLHLSGSTVWINNLIRAMEEREQPCAHIIIGREKKIKSQATHNFVTGQARKNIWIKLLRVFRAHIWWEHTYQRIEDNYYSKAACQYLGGKLAEQVLVIKDFSAPLPSFFSSQQFHVLSVLHHQYTEFESGNQNGLIAVSQAVRDGAVKLGFKVDEVIYNPLYKEKIQQLSHAFEPHLGEYIVFVGRLIPAKGVHELLKAYRYLYESGVIQHKLVFVGSGSSEGLLKSYAVQAGLKSQVVFNGFQENPYPYIKHADLLILPSYSEAMGYVAIEAAVLGTSYLVSNFTASKEFFSEKNIFDMGSSEEEFVANLQDGISKLLREPCAALRDGVLEKMEPSNVAAQFLRLDQRLNK